jgi:hypothetical protein
VGVVPVQTAAALGVVLLSAWAFGLYADFERHPWFAAYGALAGTGLNGGEQLRGKAERGGAVQLLPVELLGLFGTDPSD